MQKFYDYPVTTAYHEASHALMVIESGFTFVSASIERLPDSRGRCRYRKPRNPTNSQRMALVQVKLAGVIGADACLNGRLKPFSGAYGDFVKARDLLRSLTSCPAEEKRLFYEAREQTWRFVCEPWNRIAILDLADELFEFGSFDARRAKVVIREARRRL